jgi:hypothetical protein
MRDNLGLLLSSLTITKARICDGLAVSVITADFTGFLSGVPAIFTAVEVYCETTNAPRRCW